MTSYRLFEHTADLGIEFFADSLEGLFIASASGLFDVISGIDEIKAEETFQINVEGIDMEDLLINWLRELLYLHQVKRILLCQFHISQISDTRLLGSVRGESFDAKRHEIKKEIKAVTYHDIKVSEKKGRWTARVIFDL
ncbi:MAG: archease [bacterium]|nr:archease [bacterium]